MLEVEKKMQETASRPQVPQLLANPEEVAQPPPCPLLSLWSLLISQDMMANWQAQHLSSQHVTCSHSQNKKSKNLNKRSGQVVFTL